MLRLLLQPIYYELYKRNSLDSVYRALRNNDLADCVIMAIRVLKQNNNFIILEAKEKSDSEAHKLWVEGKEAFCKGDYQKALVNYNKALMLAPVNSEAMRLSYYSRAELLLKTKWFLACVKDIETCLALNCSNSLVRKLQELRGIALPFTCIEQFACNQLSTPFTDQFFTLKGDHNSDIPCATSDVEVIMESGKPKVVAAKDIPVGTVLAVETSFIAATNMFNYETSCHYCLKMNLNLIPCEGCCVVMFCDKQCQEKAAKEGHNVECKIIDILLDDIKLPVKATLKIRQLCSSWDEFITASDNLGVDRMKNNTFADIFGLEKFSILNSHSDTHFIYGALFNRCMYFANIIHYLETCTSFLPNSPEDKSAAIRAVSRVMMHLSLYCNPIQLQQVVVVCTKGLTRLHSHQDRGYFSFLGNLANSCQPNSYVIGLRNSAALVTIAPVKKGTELTFSYIGHWLEDIQTEPFMHARKLLFNYRLVCKDCIICSGRAGILNSGCLNDAQKKAFIHFSTYYSNEMQRYFPPNIKSHFKETCHTLQALSEVPCSKEYFEVYVSFLKCVMHCVEAKFLNIVMDEF